MNCNYCEKPDFISFDQIAEIINLSYAGARERGIRLGKQISGEEIERLLSERNGKCFVALENGQIVGTLSVIRKRYNAWYYKGEAMYIRLVAVLPEKTGQHIASGLVCCAKDYCRKMDARIMTLSTPANNKPAIWLYQKHSFSKVRFWLNRDYEVIDFALWLQRPKPSGMLRTVHYALSFTRAKMKKLKRLL